MQKERTSVEQGPIQIVIHFTFSLLTNLLVAFINIYLKVYRQDRMSISEPQYYEAKAFLTQLKSAHQVLDEFGRQQAEVAKLKSYEAGIVNGSNKGEVKIVNGNLTKGNNFENSRLRSIYKFANNFFTQKLCDVNSAKSASELSSILKKASE